nr:hypothetical protein [uncultured Thiohalocapsa sp.]
MAATGLSLQKGTRHHGDGGGKGAGDAGHQHLVGLVSGCSDTEDEPEDGHRAVFHAEDDVAGGGLEGAAQAGDGSGHG